MPKPRKLKHADDVLYGGLTKKEYDFCLEYLNTGNATRSALKAYDTDDYNTAHSMGVELLQKPACIDFMDEYLVREMPEKWLLNELRKDIKSKDKTLRINALNNLVKIKGMITEKRLDLTKQKEEIGQITYSGYAENAQKVQENKGFEA